MALKFTNLLAMLRKPYMPLVPIFQPNADLSWIPNTTASAVSVTPVAPAETPDGIITEFSFDSYPQVVFLNGVSLAEDVGFQAVSATSIEFLDDLGAVFAPASNDTIRAIL